MEQNGLSGGKSSWIESGILSLKMSLNQQQSPQNPQNPYHLHHPQMVAYADHESDHHPQLQQSVKHNHPYTTGKTKLQSPLSGGDEPAGLAGEDSTSDGKRNVLSPWHRMKWTDSMTRLLIMAVFYVGDEAGSEVNDPTGKKKAGGLSQKKGKWRSVSMAMMEKGFYVSPQQCEDKFNDLNKRYKRVNDILGKGNACKVVENQSLLETMDLSPKMKKEVKKLLNSKHLFFREMHAYHNSCGHSSNAVASENAQFAANSRSETESSQMTKRVENEDEDNDEKNDENEEDDYENHDNEKIEGYLKDRNGHEKGSIIGVFSFSSSSLMQKLNKELTNIVQDGEKSPLEKKNWMKLRLMKLKEQEIRCHCQAFELEKRRIKWVKFCSKKEREMERAKLENERRRIEIERMVILVKQKEVELLDFQQQQQQQLSSNKRSDPFSSNG